VFDRTPASSVRLGPRTSEPPSTESADGVAESGTVDELEGRRLVAIAKYQDGLRRFPRSLRLLKAAGRLGVTLGWVEGNPEASPGPIDWLESAAARNTTDFETQYYLGLALAAAGREDAARPHFEAAQRFRATRTSASLQLARLASRQGDANAALGQLQLARDESAPTRLPGTLEITMLRHLHRDDEARARAQESLTRDPASSLVRYERVRLGNSDPALWVHLGADANRVLDLVDQYLAVGAYEDAVDLLQHEYPQVEPPLREPGAVVPRDSPLIAYYRGYARAHAGSSSASDYAAASRMSTTYVFPSRRSSYAVLRDALRVNPNDATAQFLLGSLYLSSGLVDPAVDAWQQARRTRTPIPTLHRSLGLALLYGRRDYAEARAVLEEGVSADPTNVEVYLALDGVLSAAGAAPRERVAALKRYPAAATMPSTLVFKLALALAESGDGTSAEQMFHGRFFPREEGGTNVRAVYVQTRVTTASLSARNGDCGAALGIIDTLSREQKDLAFTAGGLADALEPAIMARQLADIESACARDAAARARWTTLDRPLTGGGPLAIAIADEAHRRLGLPAAPDRQQRLQEALDSATRTLDSAGTSNPGSLEYARALLLSALGRTAEAREAQVRVFVLPDRNLSHALARGMKTE
jgi:tetratricopeptide (TPR) repeat protein